MLFNRINPKSAMPLYAQIIEAVKEATLTNELEAGSALPSVRGLAKELKINTLTIQKAYKALEAEGVIEIKKGIGAFISKSYERPHEESKFEVVARKLTPIIKQSKSFKIELNEFIKIIESKWSDND